MTQYIDKNAIVAEVEKKKADLIACKKDATTPEVRTAISGMIRLCKDFMNGINALEVKDVDLEKEIDSQWKDCAPVDEGMGSEFANIGIEQFTNIAKHFFELGLRMEKKDGDKKTGAELI